MTQATDERAMLARAGAMAPMVTAIGWQVTSIRDVGKKYAVMARQEEGWALTCSCPEANPEGRRARECYHQIQVYAALATAIALTPSANPEHQTAIEDYVPPAPPPQKPARWAGQRKATS